MKYFAILIVIAGFTLAEKPAPYPPKGWKPQGARLEIPSREYGVPRDANTVDITTVANEYLPPATQATARVNNDNDFLNVQRLPAADSFSQFQNFKRQQPVARARIIMAPSPAFKSQPLLLSPVFAPQFAAPKQQLREQKFGQTRNPKNDAQQLPPQEYGPPRTEQPETTEFPQRNEPEKPQNFPNTNNNNDDYDESSEESDENDEQPALAIANAQDNQFAQAQQGQLGQYYILLPDNSLQKVRYATGQNQEDRQNNGFSAQLRYSPVEPIKDPVYGYDEQGKLVRLFK